MAQTETERSRRPRVVAVMPAYNAARTLAACAAEIPREWVDEVILVDDASRDDTVAVARALGLTVFAHEQNRGYGGNQKTCYTRALEREAAIVVMVHPDHQYDPTIIPELVQPLVEGRCDAVFGSRILGGLAREGGMPGWKYLANIGLTVLENAVMGARLSEYHSGFRAYSRRYLEAVRFTGNSDGFVFDSEIIAQGGSRRHEVRRDPNRDAVLRGGLPDRCARLDGVRARDPPPPAALQAAPLGAAPVPVVRAPGRSGAGPHQGEGRPRRGPARG